MLVVYIESANLSGMGREHERNYAGWKIAAEAGGTWTACVIV